jgi:hypothetical protein
MTDQLYVYGIVPADVRVEEGTKGVGDPPAQVRVVEQDGVAALVSPVEPDRALGTPQDLKAHAALLDAAASELPVLPLRFGAVLDSEDAVREELLAAHRDEFRAALDELDGKAEYVVKGRYDSSTILTEVLEQNQQAARLREQIRDKSEDATRNERIALGELISNDIAARREADTRRVAELLNERGIDVYIRQPTHEDDAVHLACLSETRRQGELESLVRDLAEQWSGRVTLRLLGPGAAYDFVTSRG